MATQVCVFCRIISGAAESSKVYEDDLILGFLTIRQTRPGEFLMVPKEHIDKFTDLPDSLACHMLVQAQRLSRIAARRLKPPPKRMGLVVHGFGVAHAHLIAVPQHEPDDIVSARLAYVDEGQVRFSDERVPPTARADLDRIAAMLRSG